ncbi:hypothetical protein N0V94_006872 [Neodidymelliopsis sp. IMI 364377]|nr:hypothetical protein N0V94_006872 [Neodidymelliopsis sp. IMI 364377]
MFLPFLSLVLLVLTAIGGHAVQPGGDSNLTFFGAPRASLDGVLPVLSIEEDYILGQTDGVSNKAFGAAGASQCSAANPCADGSCCNSQGQCGFRDEHCKNSCVANCDATAPCGQNSEGGAKTCPLNVCCSYFGFCGATDSFCRDTAESRQSTPCQKSFGKCGTISPPTCGTGSGTASRKVAYYEAWNSRRRPCDKIYPSNIDTTGLTHLILSFATINPQTFAVGPMHPDDEKIYRDFLDLKDGSQKWVGIGGWEFSDAGVTRHTWSEMASTKSNRSAFIASLLRFLDKWNFQGVDIDWEWPGAESRGGNPAIDKRNQIDLMVELRQSLGSRGLSVVLPAQYEYLKNLDPKALEAQVDYFNVLSYDLHGPWDATVPGEGAYIKPHTDLKEIDTALNLFWFNGVSPNKINLGVANYGRGYTVADKGCAKYGCAWTGPSKAGECTQLEGVLSQCEIQRIIKAKNLGPSIIAGGAGVKQIFFDGQWVGYDDSETLQLKTGLANNRCLGGTALWAIDYASCAGGSGGLPGAPQSSSAALSPSAPVVSVAPPSTASNALSSAPATSVALSGTSVPLSFVSTESTNPSSMASDAPPPVTATSSLSSAKSSSSDATFVASSSSKISSAQPPADSASASISAPSANIPVLPPAKSSNDVSSALSPGFSTPAQTGSFTARPTTILVVPSFGSSRSVSWSPSSAGSLTGSVIASSVATTIEPPVKTSEVSTSAVTQTSSAAQATSEDSSRSEVLLGSEASSGSSTQATSGIDVSASSTAGWLQPSRSPRPSESAKSSQSSQSSSLIQSSADTTTKIRDDLRDDVRDAFEHDFDIWCDIINETFHWQHIVD